MALSVTARAASVDSRAGSQHIWRNFNNASSTVIRAAANPRALIASRMQAGFIDETSLKTNMTRTTGWSPKAARLIDHAPFGHWNTQTFIVALCHDRFDAPWVIGGAMDRALFKLSIETQLAQTLQTGAVIILDNLSSHKSPKTAEIMRALGAWFVFLSPYSPDLNPIEMACARLKALIRSAAARKHDALWKAVGHVCDRFTDKKCYNFFKAAGHETD